MQRAAEDGTEPGSTSTSNSDLRLAPFGPRGRGAEFAYTIVDSALGRMLVAGTARGISFIAFGESDRVLKRELRGDFPEAALHRNGEALRSAAGAIAAFLLGRAPMAPLTLDVRGTPFQLRVWNGLRAIPSGTTLSYGALARKVGNPRAPRAVGAAVGANPVSILIPCHRAVAADGSLHNYRWGLERKRRLLELEAAAVSR
ncbi:MAG TPA: methylated-DNA--[protein]-cysteine S-methyltransferase [Candidatus Binataceae bacterium]|jgi:O-6-methylguanine DNA methyltransferase